MNSYTTTPFQGTIVIQQGKIVDIQPATGGVTLILDGKETTFAGSFALPGMSESHAHVMGLGEKLSALALYNATSAEECVQLALQHKERLGEWLTGLGWNQELWNDTSFPHRRMLDAAFPSTPVYLRRADGHAAWCNTAALRAADIPEDVQNPEGGEFLRDEEGVLTGILVDNAMLAIMQKMPLPDKQTQRKYISKALERYASLGVTEIHDMDVAPEVVSLYAILLQENNLPIRVHSFVSGQQEEWLKSGLQPFDGDRHSCKFVKMFSDGALGSRGALLFSPYSDKSSTEGLALLSAEDMLNQCFTAQKKGWNIAIHAIGDKANYTVLDVFRTVRKHNPSAQTLLRIEHTQIVRPEDIAIFSQYNIAAAVQPIHCTSDAFMAEKRLGERCSYSYPWRTLLQHSIVMMGGSDAPIESENPLDGIHAFEKRIPLQGSESWFAKECIERVEALHAYIVSAHEYMGTFPQRGVLAIGADADLVIWNADLLNIPAEELLQAKVLATYCNGEQVYSAE